MTNACDLPYWKTGRSSPDEWIRKARDQLERVGGTITESGNIMQHGREVVLIGFRLDGDQFRIVWPVMGHEPNENLAAVRQAATMLYHDVKARCVAVLVKGARWAFHAELLLPDGETVGTLSDDRLMKLLPAMCRQPLAIEHVDEPESEETNAAH